MEPCLFFWFLPEHPCQFSNLALCLQPSQKQLMYTAELYKNKMWQTSKFILEANLATQLLKLLYNYTHRQTHTHTLLHTRPSALTDV